MATAEPLYSSLLAARKVTTVTAAYSVLLSDYLVLANASGAFDVTLPAASVATGMTFIVKRINASANTVTVKSTSGTLDGTAAATGVALDAQYKTRGYFSDGTNYHLVHSVG